MWKKNILHCKKIESLYRQLKRLCRVPRKTHAYYINTNEIPGELFHKNMITSWVKMTSYLHTWKNHCCYGYIINHIVPYFSTHDEKFCVSVRPRNIYMPLWQTVKIKILPVLCTNEWKPGRIKNFKSKLNICHK